MTDRDHLLSLVASLPYRTWAALPGNRTDAAKVAAELVGERRPAPASRYAQALVGLARNNPPAVVTVPPSTTLAVLAADLRRGGAIFTNPTSPPIEHCRALAAVGYKHVAFNVGDHDPAAWILWMGEAARNGLRVHLWAHCQTTPASSAIVKLHRLLDQANTIGARPLINIEGPQIRGDLHPDTVARVLEERHVTNAAVITDGWIVAPAGPQDWTRLAARCPILANWLPQDAPETIGPEKGAQLLDHARALGIGETVLSCGAQRFRDGTHATPAMFAASVPFVYAADNVPATVEGWRAWRALT